MGLFDDVTCDAVLPETPVPPTGGFQTKSLPEPYMDKYVITSGGLLFQVWPDGQKERIHHHGDIQFYTGAKSGEGWWEYKARFTEGKLSRIELVEYQSPTPLTPEKE